MTVPTSATSFDTFHRTVSSGWGTADSGDVWTSIGAGGSVVVTDWTVANPAAHHSLPAAVAYRFTYLAGVDQADMDMAATGSVAFTGGVTGGTLEILGLMFRGQTTSSYYLARVEVAAGGAMTLKLYDNDVATVLASVTGIVSGLTYTSGKSLSIRVRAIGPRIKVRVWDPAGVEPSTWDISIANADTLTAGFVGVRSGVGVGNTNTKPVVFAWTEFWLSPPIVITSSSGRPFLRQVLGSSAAIATEFAAGADLTADPDTWPWAEITPDVRHADGTSTTVGRADNVSSAPTAQHTCGLNNPNGNYSPQDPDGAHYPDVTRNMPVRQLLTIDGSTWFTRFQGYLNSLQPAATDMSNRVSTVALTALGMLGRIAGRKRPVRSALYRSVSTMPNLLAYWPMEDGSTATSCAPAVGTTSLVAIAGTPKFGADGAPGSAAAVDFTGGPIMRGRVPLSSVATSWRVAFSVLYTGAPGGDFTPLYWTCTDGSAFLVDFAGGGGGFVLNMEYVGRETAGFTQAFACPWLDTDTTTWHSFQIVAVQNGADVDIAVSYDNTVWHPASATAILTSTTLAPVATVVPGKTYVDPTAAFSLCHLAVASPTAINPSLTAPDVASATAAYVGETADDRLIRICGEENIQLNLTGSSNVAMGRQTIQTRIALIQECETADHGLLYDGLGPGIGYICRSAIYGIGAAYSLDMSVQEVTTPTAGFFDLQGVTNIVTAQRQGGSSATVERVDGPTGTALIGDDDTSPTLNVATDDVLPFHAGFLAGLGDPAGYRVPKIAPNVRIIPATLPALLAAGLRHRVAVDNPPRRELGPDSLQVLVEGWTETTVADHWTLVFNTSPFAPWNVGDRDTGHLDTSGATCAGSHSAGVTSFGVNTTSGPLWTINAGDFPFDIMVNGERMTVTNITGTSSPQTFTVTRAVNGVSKATTTGDVVTLVDPVQAVL